MNTIKMKNKSAVEQLKDRLINIFSTDTSKKKFDKKDFENEAKKVRNTFNHANENSLPSRNLA